jgi:hypothetical protein
VLAQIPGGLLGAAAYRLRTKLAGEAFAATLDLDVPITGKRARVRFVKDCSKRP